MDQNPALIRSTGSLREGAAPLILIHDGGGTTLSYHYLQNLSRTVYAIHNPRFYSGRVWVGGITAMAKVYVELIRSVLSSGPLIIGGWSLGGLIALEMASLLSKTADFDLLGLVMIDSICPKVLKFRTQNIAPHSPFTLSRCKPEIRCLISAQLRASANMVENWTLPTWSSRSYPTAVGQIWTRIAAYNSSEVNPSTARSASLFSCSRDRSGERSTPPLITYSDSQFDNKSSSSLLIEHIDTENEDDREVSPDSPPTPPTILLRCNEYVPLPGCKNPNAVSKVDIARDCRVLGWDEYNPDLVRWVLDVPGHHFNVFAEENIHAMETRIEEACDILELMGNWYKYKACDADSP